LHCLGTAATIAAQGSTPKDNGLYGLVNREWAAIMDRTAKHILFSGQVQGVGFRYTARHIAGRYDITGFVRNLPDGNVEMLAQGPERDVDNCIADIQAEFAGYLRDTQIEPVPYSSRYTDFRITF
jgi:acylphosphatase